jgi:hypothetical protein
LISCGLSDLDGLLFHFMISMPVAGFELCQKGMVSLVDQLWFI